jgi:hypothetical protein
LVLLLTVACFFAGMRFERERQRREDEAAAAVAAVEAERALFNRKLAELAALKREIAEEHADWRRQTDSIRRGRKPRSRE